jgi:nucleotide-binding universal stress UspA family protein
VKEKKSHMKNTIIVTTDFSDTSKNALDYAAALAADTGKEIVLAHIYIIPTGYAAEGVSLATINDSMESETQMLADELNRVNVAWPGVSVSTRMLVGSFVETVQDLCLEITPETLLIGAYGEYSDLVLWESEWLRVVTSVHCPVLVVPSNCRYATLSRIAFACDYKSPCSPLQLATLTSWAHMATSGLDVVHVTQNPTAEIALGAIAGKVHAQLEALSPTYHIITQKPVIEAMADFVKDNPVDLLVVIPRVHSFWHSLFNKSYSKELARLSNTPVLAIHVQDVE